MASRTQYEGFVHADTPISHVMRKGQAQRVVSGMVASRKSQKAKVDAAKAEAYQKGILDVLYAHQVLGVPIPGMEKFVPPAPPMMPPPMMPPDMGMGGGMPPGMGMGGPMPPGMPPAAPQGPMPPPPMM